MCLKVDIIQLRLSSYFVVLLDGIARSSGLQFNINSVNVNIVRFIVDHMVNKDTLVLSASSSTLINECE